MSKVPVLIVVDAQNDFISGSLKNVDPQFREVVDASIVPAIAQRIKDVHEAGGIVITTRDEHMPDTYQQSIEGRCLPVAHCEKGTWGYELDPRVKDVVDPDNDYAIYKDTYGSFELANLLMSLDDTVGISEICLVGFCTDICVIANAVIARTALPFVPVFHDTYASAGVDSLGASSAIEVMKRLNVNVVPYWTPCGGDCDACKCSTQECENSAPIA